MHLIIKKSKIHIYKHRRGLGNRNNFKSSSSCCKTAWEAKKKRLKLKIRLLPSFSIFLYYCEYWTILDIFYIDCIKKWSIVRQNQTRNVSWKTLYPKSSHLASFHLRKKKWQRRKKSSLITQLKGPEDNSQKLTNWNAVETCRGS